MQTFVYMTLAMYQRNALMNNGTMIKRHRMMVCFSIHFNIMWETEIQLVSVGWMKYTACPPIPCFLEYCHPEEQNRALVGEGWVAAGPLRGLFLQGHTHAWSEAHRGGSGTRRLYLLCLTFVTPHNTSYRTITLCQSGFIKRVQPIEECVFFFVGLTRFAPDKEKAPLSSGSLWSLKVIMSGSLQWRHPHAHCTQMCQHSHILVLICR